jgi:hypothetical protein
MNFINFAIIILIIILLFLHKHFNIAKENYITDIIPQSHNNNSINFNNNFKTFLKNYGIVGSHNIPPMPPADPVRTDFNCSNYLWDYDDKNTQVCQRVNDDVIPFDENNVYARYVGNPRISSLL